MENIATVARLGVRDYIVKPFDQELLLAKTSRVVTLVTRPNHERRGKKPAPPSERAGETQGSASSGEPTEPKPAQATPLQRASVLVVDDSRTMRLSLIRGLNELGFDNIKEAENGRQALELVLKGPFDLMLLDMEMPEMNGMEVLLALKNNPQLRGLPVIVISGADQIENAVRCIEAGAEDYLPKPFNPTLLRARATSSIEKKRLRDLDRVRLVQLQTEKDRTE